MNSNLTYRFYAELLYLLKILSKPIYGEFTDNLGRDPQYEIVKHDRRKI